MRLNVMAPACAFLAAAISFGRAGESAKPWRVGAPIVTYWAGPPMTDQTATQMAEGGWNLIWCAEKDLDVAARHKLRAQLQDELLAPASLESPGQKEKLDALIERVRRHPALYSYFITDEPNATNFPALSKLVRYLRERDPAHLAYINLFPTYATNEQLGNSGEKVTAYQAHLRQYIETVKPWLVSYDHYQCSVKGDTPDYFLNLGLVRRASLDAGLPFLNIVQAATWTPSMRVPNADELRFLVYTTLAYGAQGISYYVYCCAGHTGGIANPDGSPTPVYSRLWTLNREFVGIAGELQPLKSMGVYHAGMIPPGGEPLPEQAEFVFEPPIPAQEYKAPEPLQGALIGVFGKVAKRAKPTHALVVNLDYHADRVLCIRGPGRLEVFDPTFRLWKSCRDQRLELGLGPGAGVLVRVRR